MPLKSYTFKITQINPEAAPGQSEIFIVKVIGVPHEVPPSKVGHKFHEIALVPARYLIHWDEIKNMRRGSFLMGNEITVAEAAELLGVVEQHVRRMIKTGAVPARKFGRDWRIVKEDLANIERSPVGRPRKTLDAATYHKRAIAAKTFCNFGGMSAACFWNGYVQGLRKAYHGDKFNSPHPDKFLENCTPEDLMRRAYDLGYQVGCEGTDIPEALEIAKKFDAKS